jgi:hypothetical protein
MNGDVLCHAALKISWRSIARLLSEIRRDVHLNGKVASFIAYV